MLRTSPDPAQTNLQGLDWLSLLSPNQQALVRSIMRTVGADRHIKNPKDAVLFLRRELHRRVCRSLSEQESSAYSVTIRMSADFEESCLTYISACLETYRRKPAPVKHGRRRAA